MRKHLLSIDDLTVDDVETLFGDSAALALGADFDPEAVFESSDGADVPIALKVDGDPEEIEAVLEKLRAQLTSEEMLVLDSDAEGDTVVVMEAMKMEQPLKAHKAGTVTGLQAEVGATVTNGAVICEIKG